MSRIAAGATAYLLAFFTASRAGKTGLAPTVDVYEWREAGVVKVVSDAAAVVIGGGLYGYTHAAGATAVLIGVFKTADATVDFAQIPATILPIATAENTSTAGSIGAAIAAVKSSADAAARAGDPMSLTNDERIATANVIEAQIIDDTDSEKVLTAITDKIAAVNPSLDDLTLAAIAAAVRNEVERAGGTLAAAKTAAESADGKLTPERLGKIDGSLGSADLAPLVTSDVLTAATAPLATSAGLTAAQEAIVDAVQAGTPADWIAITAETIDTSGDPLGVIDRAGVEIVAYLATDLTFTTPISKAISEIDGDFTLRVPPAATYTLVARSVGRDYGNRTVTV